jgi:hypothetical protein
MEGHVGIREVRVCTKNKVKKNKNRNTQTPPQCYVNSHEFMTLFVLD